MSCSQPSSAAWLHSDESVGNCRSPAADATTATLPARALPARASSPSRTMAALAEFILICVVSSRCQAAAHVGPSRGWRAHSPPAQLARWEGKQGARFALLPLLHDSTGTLTAGCRAGSSHWLKGVGAAYERYLRKASAIDAARRVDPSFVASAAGPGLQISRSRCVPDCAPTRCARSATKHDSINPDASRGLPEFPRAAAVGVLGHMPHGNVGTWVFNDLQHLVGNHNSESRHAAAAHWRSAARHAGKQALHAQAPKTNMVQGQRTMRAPGGAQTTQQASAGVYRSGRPARCAARLS